MLEKALKPFERLRADIDFGFKIKIPSRLVPEGGARTSLAQTEYLERIRHSREDFASHRVRGCLIDEWILLRAWLLSSLSVPTVNSGDASLTRQLAEVYSGIGFVGREAEVKGLIVEVWGAHDRGDEVGWYKGKMRLRWCFEEVVRAQLEFMVGCMGVLGLEERGG